MCDEGIVWKGWVPGSEARNAGCAEHEKEMVRRWWIDDVSLIVYWVRQDVSVSAPSSETFK